MILFHLWPKFSIRELIRLLLHSNISPCIYYSMLLNLVEEMKWLWLGFQFQLTSSLTQSQGENFYKLITPKLGKQGGNQLGTGFRVESSASPMIIKLTLISPKPKPSSSKMVNLWDKSGAGWEKWIHATHEWPSFHRNGQLALPPPNLLGCLCPAGN